MVPGVGITYGPLWDAKTLTTFETRNPFLRRLTLRDDSKLFLKAIGNNTPLPFVVVIADSQTGISKLQAAFMVKTTVLDALGTGIGSIVEIAKILVENLLSALVLERTGALKYASNLLDTVAANLPF